jgi:Fe-S oxidoreductase
VLEHAGLRVVVPREPVCCGLPWISTGQLGVAQRVLRRSLRVLQRYGDLPVLGLEPSCTAVLRSDGPDLLGGQKGPMSSDTPGHKGPMTGLYGRTRTLAELLTEHGWQPPRLDVDALVQVHCHQHAVLGFDPDAALLEAAGVRVERVGGCCGLAGNFGFERRHYDVSMAVGEQNLLPAARNAAPDTIVLADGFSCRTQLADGAGRSSLHLAQLLDLAVSSAAASR